MIINNVNKDGSRFSPATAILKGLEMKKKTYTTKEALKICARFEKICDKIREDFRNILLNTILHTSIACEIEKCNTKSQIIKNNYITKKKILMVIENANKYTHPRSDAMLNFIPDSQGILTLKKNEYKTLIEITKKADFTLQEFFGPSIYPLVVTKTMQKKWDKYIAALRDLKSLYTMYLENPEIRKAHRKELGVT